MNRYIHTFAIMLAAWLTASNGMAQEQNEGEQQNSGSGSSSKGVRIYGSVYGGGNNADVQVNTAVNISAGQVDGNVYGGGNVGDVGTINKSADYNYTWTQTDGNSANNAGNNDISNTNNNTGLCTVTISGGAIGSAQTADENHGNVFGAGKGKADTWWCEKAIAYATSVSINAGTVYNNVYGGGQIGRVEDDAKVTIGGASAEARADIKGSVFGAGAGLQTHGYSALVRGDTKVTVEGYALVGHSVYGGGETASVGRFTVVGGLPKHPDSGGKCTVIIQDNAKVGTSGTGHNVYGACKGVTPAYVAFGENRSKSMQLRTNAPDDPNLWSDYNGDSSSPFIWRYYATKDDYKAFLQTLALTSHPTVTIAENAEVYGSVYGGGERGLTLGDVAVNIQGGTIEQDVYGGGALANTNAGNWDADGYTEVTELETGASVTGLYTRTGAGTTESPYSYTVTTNETAVSSTIYYSKGKWEDADLKTAKYTTTVNLTDGLIKGDAYGGGLGQKEGFNGATEDIEAVVWGDINVTLGGTYNTTTKTTTASSSATAFNITHYGGDHADVVKSGRVFGCNNLNGSPQGSVTVDVWKTVAGNTNRTTEDDDNTGNATKNEGQHHNYEVAAVYGGGNLADYTATEKKTEVIIETCDVSIESVYGGGNAAPAPETDVLIKGAYEISEVFGGGNGRDKYTTGTTWVENPGADVNGNATTLLKGGYVHAAYGGSNKKGTIYGNVTIDTSTGGFCNLDVAKIVGAGKDADVNGDLIMVMGCKPSDKVPVLYAGADNANVNGDVELTITSGNFGQVFGGNNQGGIIMGHIKLNIEETGDCSTPITIDELYLGGNEAAYSMYGYYKDGDTFKPRTAEMAVITDPNAEGYTPAVTTEEFGTEVRKNAPYDAPELNIVSCTYIGKVFGGGLGTGAAIYGNPTVNINMIKGTFANDYSLGVPYYMSAKELNTTDNPNNLGIIGDVYGGGNAADVIGNTTVNIGTETTVRLHESLQADGVTYNMSDAQNVLGAYIAGNVFGGGKGEAKMTAGTAGEAFLCAKAMVNGNEGTHVNIGNGFVRGNVYGGGEVGRIEHNTAVKIGLDSGTSAPVVKGNVFGAGAGTNTHGYSALVRGNSTVIVQADSKVLGSVYGGGEKASVGKYKVVDGLPVALAPDNEHPNSGYCYVTIRGNAEIGPDDMEMTKAGGPSDAGHVFGAGKGVLPYEGYAATEKPQHMNGTQHLVGGVWDNKSWDDQLLEYPAYDSSQKLDVNYVKFIKSLALATQTVVTIEGNAFVKGSVYGGSENGYVQQNTTVYIQGDCQIGNGYVQMDDDGNYLNKLATPLTPLAVNRRYTSEEWGQGKLIPDQTKEPELYTLVNGKYYTSSLPECASWLYGQAADAADRYAPYDREANTTGNLGQYADGSTTEGGRAVGDDGHTFYGNVFGGGSGYYPYKPGRWFEDAGAVYGNTEVNITGGHILTNVYGGNEMTNVSGTCTVNFGGTATLGVPRTLKQIDAHPVTCYLFGAGKGDQRVFFNKSTNVKDVVVNIRGGRIYGSVFGGGEDGHVLRDVTMTIGQQTTTGEGQEVVTTTSGPTIGTWGTSYVDGNIFGGGRGFGGDAYTAGNVAGSVTMQIKGGKMLGSIYGGGRLGSVGYGLFDEETNGQPTPGYGEMRADTDTEDGFTDGTPNFFTKGRGHIDITISGGTIGNELEYIVPNSDNTPTGLSADNSSAWTTDNWKAWKAHNHIPKTEFDASGRLTHTKGGNVFAGGMGRQTKLDGQTPISGIDWWKLGCVKQTKLTITGGTIKSNVYGGGELGAVIPTNDSTEEGGKTEINISGSAIIGTVVSAVTTGSGESAQTNNEPLYTFGSVFGGGMGSESDTSAEEKIGGRVAGSTKITMSAGAVKGSVYGGGELAIVQGSHTTSDSKTVGAEINISGGTIGYNQDGFGGATMGNVYGAGKGSLETKQAGLIKSNTLINISGGNIYHNIYGGGAYGSVGTFTYETSGSTLPASTPSGCTEGTGTAWINITGGNIGINGHENGMVFGSSRGNVAAPDATGEDPNNKLAWVKNTYVTIGTSAGSESSPWVRGSVYGSGENGHVLTDTNVKIHNGKIGIEESDGAKYDITTYKGAAYPSRGNVYGGGCGTDTYAVTTGAGDNAVTKYYFNRSAGIVRGNSTITMDGGQVVRTIYGGGAMGSIGKFTRTSKVEETDPYYSDSHVPGIVSSCVENTGLATVSISGGTVGPKNDTTIPDGAGNVFGASRGEIHDATEYPNLERMVFVDKTDVNISDAAIVKGSVYGGSEAGHVLSITDVSMTGGSVDQNIYGGGNLGDVGLYTTDAGGANIYATGKGVCQVSISGGTVTGNVFGAGKGEGTTFTCEKAMVNSTTVTVENGTVNGNVYGGGEVGRVESNTVVTIGKADGNSSAPDIKGSVFGAGAGLETHGYSALVRGNTTVTVQGKAKVGENVYGGGETASVGRYGLDAEKMPSILLGGGVCAVTVGGNAVIGQGATGNVFGACKGVDPVFDSSNKPQRMTAVNGESTWETFDDADSYFGFLETLALATRPTVTIKGSANVNGSVYGGGERGITKGTVVVNIEGGTVAEDVYGGGALANTNTTKLVGKKDANGIPLKDGDDYVTTEVHPTTTVNLTGGTINRNVYGGGLGRLAKDAVEAQDAVSAVEAKVYGDVLVELNKPTTTTGEGEGATTTTTYGDCVVKGNIFGCNNLNGSPQAGVTVHVYKTADYAGHEKDASKSNSKFNVNAVYGGGNLAAYYPDDKTTRATAVANVIIDGCDLTSIGTVYGGGNAASVPETDVVINSAYEIGEVFGGGNGKDQVSYDGGLTYVDNPGANVGYLAYSSDSEKKDKAYGTGKAHATIYGGTVHKVYGGSNTKGNVRVESRATLMDADECEFNVEDSYGGGNNALQDGNAILEVDCISGLGKAYGGASNADVNGNVILNITNGTYGQVFGGNDMGGCIRGSITVNVEETGCRPVIIGELYGGGNQAAYSVYGYDASDNPLKAGDSGVNAEPVPSPVVNVKSFTSIGTIYGGGYGASATMVGDPTVNVNVYEGKYYNSFLNHDNVIEDNARVVGSHVRTSTSDAGYDTGYPVPSHKKGEIGAINNVFGGGNAAEVVGTTHVNIGTEAGEEVYVEVYVKKDDSVGGLYTRSGEVYTAVTGNADSGTTYYLKTAKAVDIRGNVYGGGNNAEVTGDTKVVIGKKAE